MKKFWSVLIGVIVVFIIFPMKVKADMFPKPTAIVEVVGVDVPYKFEVLVKKVSWHIDLDFEARIDYYYYDDEFPLEFFKDFVDDDGYASRTLYGGDAPTHLHQLDTNTFKIGYFSAPKNFKIAILIDDEIIITSKAINRKMHQAKFTFDLTGVDLTKSQFDVGKIKEEVPIGKIILNFILRVFLTIAIELGILWLFKYRDKYSFILVTIINLISQSILTLFTLYSHYVWLIVVGPIIVIVLGEFFVFTFEAIIYLLKLKEKTKLKAIIYALVSNLVTCLLSILSIALL